MGGFTGFFVAVRADTGARGFAVVGADLVAAAVGVFFGEGGGGDGGKRRTGLPGSGSGFSWVGALCMYIR